MGFLKDICGHGSYTARFVMSEATQQGETINNLDERIKKLEKKTKRKLNEKH